jgi:hypothetical protein
MTALYNSGVLNQITRADYAKARFYASLRGLLAFVFRRNNRLLSLSALLNEAEIVNQHSLGVCTIPIERIVGSMARTEDFDRNFAPRQEFTEHRWLSIAKAMYRGIPLPAIELVLMSGRYYVVDGHHRVSAARALGQKFIDAHVTEITIR